MKPILYLFILTSLISCKKTESLSDKSPIAPTSPEVIFEYYKSSVVLVATQYYFELEIKDSIFYYSPASEQKIFSTKDDVLKNLSSGTGTGFAISNNGEIITNKHVVNPKDENYQVAFADAVASAKESISNDINYLNTEIENTQNQYNLLSRPQDSYAMDILAGRYHEMVSKRDTLHDLHDFYEWLNLNDLKSRLVIYQVGIAYNDTNVDNFDDLQECTIVKLSDDENVDLALIQTNSGTFNTTPSNIFNFYDKNPNVAANPEEFPERDISKPVNINDDVFMIGYNRGFSLANTQLGIKSQFTSGKVSQECDGVRILYTIPTLEGSSGSPVVDKWGNLVGVNFAKMTDTQSFGFAIPVYQLKRFYEQ